MDNSATIRYATPEDIESLRLIQRNDGFEHVYYLSKYRLDNLFKRGEVFFIAFINEKPGAKEIHIIKDAPHTFVEKFQLEEIKKIFSKWIDKIS